MGAGRPKAFKHPKEITYHFNKYKEWLKLRPNKETIFHQKTGEAVTIEKERPLTWFGFEMYLNEKGIIANLNDYKGNRHNSYSEFSEVLRVCEVEISECQLTGAMNGIYQHNLVARMRGLVDKQEMEVKEIPLTLEEQIARRDALLKKMRELPEGNETKVISI